MVLSTQVKRIIILLVLVLGATAFFAVKVWFKPPPPPLSVAPSVQLLESRLIGRKDGQRQWEILTKSVLQTGDIVTLSDFDQIIMFQEEEPYLFIQAESAVWERKKDLLELNGPVVVEGEDSFRLESDFLLWDGAKETLVSPGPVVFYWNKTEITAQEMVFETETDLLYLTKDVEIRDGSFLWQVEKAVYNLGQDVIEFYGAVHAEEEAENEI